jgi:hypothetical protein
VTVPHRGVRRGHLGKSRCAAPVLTDRASEVVGRVADDRARPVSNAGVIVFSADRSRWYPASRFMRDTTTTPDGSFRISGLPGGNYFVAAPMTTPPW